MSTLLIITHIITCIILILAVLLQSGKSADLAGAFGGVGSQSVFGPRGAASLLGKVTTICAVLFMITSFGLWLLSAKGTKSVISKEEAPAKTATAATADTKKEGVETKNQDNKQQQKPAKEKQNTEKEKK